MNEHFTHIYGVWFVGGKGSDWMAMLGVEDGCWVFHYRFRYYDGQQEKGPHEDGDTKSFYAWKAQDDSTETRDAMLAGLAGLLPVMEIRYESKVDFVLLDCPNDDPKVMFELGSRPWVHMKLEKDHLNVRE